MERSFFLENHVSVRGLGEGGKRSNRMRFLVFAHNMSFILYRVATAIVTMLQGTTLVLCMLYIVFVLQWQCCHAAIS